MLHKNPLVQFESWYSEAIASGEKHPDAMTLATATRKGAPSARIVLYKGLSKGAFRLFTNYESRKGRELIENPRAALTFHWKALDRQVRIEGRIRTMSKAESKRYFHSRPRPSQIGAWASRQSQPIASRELLMERVRHYELMFEGREVPLPPHWGGFLLLPERIEFWKDGEFRLHDRFLFERARGSRSWKSCRLSP
jgi:pyridoxamine 5'-phosphate oxidase